MAPTSSCTRGRRPRVLGRNGRSASSSRSTRAFVDHPTSRCREGDPTEGRQSMEETPERRRATLAATESEVTAQEWLRSSTSTSRTTSMSRPRRSTTRPRAVEFRPALHSRTAVRPALGRQQEGLHSYTSAGVHPGRLRRCCCRIISASAALSIHLTCRSTPPRAAASRPAREDQVEPDQDPQDTRRDSREADTYVGVKMNSASS